jgi:hypothetical protein
LPCLIAFCGDEQERIVKSGNKKVSDIRIFLK